MVMFSEVYAKMWGLVKEPISEMYSTLMDYIERGSKVPTDLPPAVPTDDGAALEKIVNNFFGKMFPLVYHQAIHHLDSKDFSDDYKKCLRDNMDSIQPFDVHPRSMGKAIAKSFESMKVVLEALSLGIEVLSTTDELMSSRHENTETCREALLKLYYCPKCLGLPSSVKPCNGYCLNVMRGCLTQQRTTELDLPWSNFLMETQSLVREIRQGLLPNIDFVLNGLSVKISDAIMYATLEGPTIEKKVHFNFKY
ncbi:division abnormally delayed protein [Cimex lectularius]|uniref:Glypican-5 n=1 Tax=Cimex lectularius TaxID=79782 RepID=A0A8I6SNL6_CIMLE|nr:division abnormally delayed protein [Cimex lectularius]